MIKTQLEYYGVKAQTLDEDWIKRICQTIFNDSGHLNASVTIIFSNDSELCKLKKKYFGEELLTDTISFNLEEKGKPIEGEVYISLDRVYENSKKFKQNFITEYKRVIIHSCLHLIGYSDELPKDKLEMTDMEDIYLVKE